MKFAICCLVVSLLLLSLVDHSSGTKNCRPKQAAPKSIKTSNSKQRVVFKPNSKARNTPAKGKPNQGPNKRSDPRPAQQCSICGPGGRPCPRCPQQSELCQQLLGQLKVLRNKIKRCVCGQRT